MKHSILLLFFLIAQEYFAQSIDTLSYQDNTIYSFSENPAEFPGGSKEMLNFIAKNIVYPQTAIKNKISGKCFIKFIVEKNGEISNISILRGVNNCPECDIEAVRVVKLMPHWKPATNEGKTVRTLYNLPINFNFE